MSEYPAGPAAAVLMGAAAWAASRRAGSWRRVAPAVFAMALAALVCAVALAIYHHAAFGSAVDTGLNHLVGFDDVRANPFSWPRASALFGITLGPQRGLFPLAPLLVLAPVGWALAWREPQRRLAVVVGVLITVYYLLLNASFATPMAGWSYGPRYLGAALPFFALPLAFVWDAARGRWFKALLVVGLVWGVALSLVAVATTAQPPEVYERPVAELLLPAFVDGDLALNHQSFLEPNARAEDLRGVGAERKAWNLGQRLGLRGLWSLLPLALAALALAWPLRRWVTEPPG